MSRQLFNENGKKLYVALLFGMVLIVCMYLKSIHHTQIL